MAGVDRSLKEAGAVAISKRRVGRDWSHQAEAKMATRAGSNLACQALRQVQRGAWLSGMLVVAMTIDVGNELELAKGWRANGKPRGYPKGQLLVFGGR